MKTIKNLTADEIRKSILQLAIQGKLVKQDPNDEPASELVKRIYEEKKKLIKDGKIKKDNNESYIFKGEDNCYYEKVGNKVTNITDELPFEIPNNWTWVRLKNLVKIETGKKDANFGSTGGSYDFFTCAMQPIKSKSYSYDGEYLILPGNGANVGKSIHYFGKFEAYQRTYLLSKLIDIIYFEYLKINFDTRWLEYNKNKLFGSAIPYIKLNNIEEFLIPLPSINEQKKIVKIVYKFEPLLERYQSIETKLSNYESLFEEKLKASILQYAIEGKLVRQDPNDEPASVLLERIKQEKERLISEGKIKRDKHESEIIAGDDKNYYENYFVEGSLKSFLFPMKSTKPSGLKFKYIDIDAIDNEENKIKYPKVLPSTNATSRARRKLNEGDVLYSLVRPYLKNIARVENYYDCIGSTGFYVCSPLPCLDTDYLFYFLLSPQTEKAVMKFMRGLNSPSITTTVLEDIKIKLPSYKTQRKIVNKIEILLKTIGN